MIATVPAILLPAFLGYMLVSVVLKGDRCAGPLQRASLGYPAGMGILTMQMFVLGLMRIPLSLPYILPLILAEAAALIAVARRRGISLAPRPSFGILEDFSAARHPLWLRAAMALLLVWASAKMASVFFQTGLRPIFAWDGWANWSAGAKLFYHSKSLLLDAPPEEFFGRGAVNRIISYPLHNHMMQVWMALWADSFDEVLVKLWSPFYLLSLSLYLYLFAAEKTGRPMALGLLVIFLSSPLMSYHATEVYSDLCLGAYIFFAVASFMKAMEGNTRYLAISGLFSAQAMFVKDEALFFVLPFSLSVLLFLWKEKKGGLYPAGLLFLLPFVFILPWYAFKFSHSLSLGAEIVSRQLTFKPGHIIQVALNFLLLQNFNVLFVFIPILLILSGRPGRQTLHVLLPLLSYFVFFVSLYVFTAYYEEHFRYGTVFYRNMLTIYPAAWLLAVTLLKKAPPKQDR